MSHILPLTAQEVEQRLLKVADIAAELAVHAATTAGDAIVVTLGYSVADGSEVKFKAPVDCSEITRLQVQYIDENKESVSKTFAFADANGNNVSEINNLFSQGSIVKVILDFDVDIDGNGTGAAFVQNADTNAYLEGRLTGLADTLEDITTDVDECLFRNSHQFMYEYNSALKNEIVECALTYYRNADKLYYGNDSVATCTRKNRLTPLGYYSGYVNEENYGDTFHWTVLEKVGNDLFYFYPAAHANYRTHKYNNEYPEDSKMFTCPKADVETYMAEARAKAGSLVCQIDCSSFAHLVMSGIPFEHSRYAKWMNTNSDTDNVSFYEWGYQWDTIETEKYFTNRGRLGAADMAQYCYDKGYGIEVTDWKKLQTGDLLFQTWPESTDNVFRKVGHVMIYLCPCTTGSSNENDHWVIDVGATDEAENQTAPVSIKRIGVNHLKAAYSNVTYAGRLPITLNRTKQPRNLVKSTSSTLPLTLENTDQYEVLRVDLSETLKKDTMYTIVVDMDFDEQVLANNVNPEVCISYNKSFIGARKKIATNRTKNLYSFTTHLGWISSADYDQDTNYFMVLTRQNYTNARIHHDKTVVRGVYVYEGIYPNSTIGSLSISENIYKQNDAPTDAPDGTLWLDLDAEAGGVDDTHVSNKNNPHGVTAAQVGAVPAARKINGKALTSDIILSVGDIDGATTKDGVFTTGTWNGNYDEAHEEHLGTWWTKPNDGECSNYPEGATFGFLTTVKCGDQIKQTYTQYATGKTWVRSRVINNGVAKWHGWFRIDGLEAYSKAETEEYVLEQLSTIDGGTW